VTVNLNRMTGNILGWLSVAASITLWAFALLTGRTELPASHIDRLFVLSFILPPFAAWWASRWWLLMLLSPIAWYLVFKVFPTT
jgi:hypothetical protein